MKNKKPRKDQRQINPTPQLQAIELQSLKLEQLDAVVGGLWDAGV